MKTGLIVAGVGVLMAAVYFVARGKTLPTLNSKQASGQVKQPSPNQSLVSSLLTSQNIGAITTLFGGAAKPAPAAGVNGSGLQGIVTSLDEGSRAEGVSGMVTSIDD